MNPPKPETLHVTLKAETAGWIGSDKPTLIQRLRNFLKDALRRHGLRATAVRAPVTELPAIDPAHGFTCSECQCVWLWADLAAYDRHQQFRVCEGCYQNHVDAQVPY